MRSSGRSPGPGAVVLACGAAIAWSNAVLPRLARRGGWGRGARGAATAVFCVADAALARSAVPAAAGSALGGALAVIGLSNAMPVQREPSASLARWVLVDIPLGTVLGEEVLFRGALTPRLEEVFGTRTGRLAGPAVFALWHVGAARASEQPVLPTIGVTFVTGWAFDLLVRKTGRSCAAFAAHWAINSCGAVLSSGSVFSSHRIRPRTLDDKA